MEVLLCLRNPKKLMIIGLYSVNTHRSLYLFSWKKKMSIPSSIWDIGIEKKEKKSDRNKKVIKFLRVMVSVERELHTFAYTHP